jgi:hypothetical protein
MDGPRQALCFLAPSLPRKPQGRRAKPAILMALQVSPRIFNGLASILDLETCAMIPACDYRENEAIDHMYGVQRFCMLHKLDIRLVNPVYAVNVTLNRIRRLFSRPFNQSRQAMRLVPARSPRRVLFPPENYAGVISPSPAVYYSTSTCR